MRYRYLAAIAALTIGSASAHAQPVNVDYVVTGSAGNWLYNFKLSNSISTPTDMNFYLFGVNLGPTAVAASPANWSQFISWTTTSGSGTKYYNTWMTDAYLGVGAGQSLSGFSVHNYDVVAPTSVKWFAYAISAYSGGEYTGGDNFNYGGSLNPGFEGTARGTYPLVNIVSQVDEGPPVVVTPEPSTYLLMASGLSALAYVSRRKRKVTT